MREASSGSSPKHSSLRPQRGSRSTSRQETSARSTPSSASCLALTPAAEASSSSSKQAAEARFTGSRQPSSAWCPWGHSVTISTGMPSRERSMT